MMLWNTFAMAMRQIWRHKMRSSLTALGIVIGVAAVIAMVHIGQAATLSVTSDISAMGDNLLYVQPTRDRSGAGGASSAARPFDMADVRFLEEQVDGVLIAPVGSSSAVIASGDQKWSTSVTGTTEDWFDIRNHTLTEGRFFDSADDAACVIGKTVESELFGGGGALDQRVRVGKMSCIVVGVLASKGSSMGQDQDDLVVMPIETLQRRLTGSRNVSQIMVSAVDRTTESAAEEIRLVMRERRSTLDDGRDDFEVRDMAEIVAAVQSTTQVLTLLLGAVAGVSLLVGGIGIMNIMLVSVTERTREIGIRIALGALGREVLLQFVVESAVLSMVGGILGIALGLGGSFLVSSKFDLPFVFVPEIVTLAFVFSALIGVLFGFIPARKAARLDPIEALRHE